MNRKHFDEQLDDSRLARKSATAIPRSMLMRNTQSAFLRSRTGAPVMQVKEKKELKAPWKFIFYTDVLETKSGKPWFSKEGREELLWEEGYPQKYKDMPKQPSWFSREGQLLFWGADQPKEKKEKEPFLFTPKGWKNMQEKYGVKPDYGAPLYTPKGLSSFIGYGDRW